MSWEPINREARPTTGDASPRWGQPRVPRQAARVLGPPKSAKTLGAYANALEEIRRGGNVLLIDFEMGPWDTRDRLREMGATDDDLKRFFYVEPETPASEEIVAGLAGRWTFTLVILDAAAGAYSLQGLDDNARKDVERFTRIYVQAFRLRDVATIVLDHVGKNAQGRGAFAIGSERKVGGADVHLGFETVLAISRGSRGLYKVTTHKDRLGHLSGRRRPSWSSAATRGRTLSVGGQAARTCPWGRLVEADAPDGKGVPVARKPAGRGQPHKVRGKRPGKGRLRPPRLGRTHRRRVCGGIPGGTRLPACSKRPSVPRKPRPRPSSSHPVPTPSRRVTNDPVPRPTPYRGDGVGRGGRGRGRFREWSRSYSRRPLT